MAWVAGLGNTLALWCSRLSSRYLRRRSSGDIRSRYFSDSSNFALSRLTTNCVELLRLELTGMLPHKKRSGSKRDKETTHLYSVVAYGQGEKKCGSDRLYSSNAIFVRMKIAWIQFRGFFHSVGDLAIWSPRKGRSMEYG